MNIRILYASLDIDLLIGDAAGQFEIFL